MKLLQVSLQQRQVAGSIGLAVCHPHDAGFAELSSHFPLAQRIVRRGHERGMREEAGGRREGRRRRRDGRRERGGGRGEEGGGRRKEGGGWCGIELVDLVLLL